MSTVEPEPALEDTSGTFAGTDTALAMRDLIAEIVGLEISRLRPEYSYATVVRIDRRRSMCRVAFPGDLGEADVRLGGVVPAMNGQIVRIDGLPNDRSIVDVMGPAADAFPGDVRFRTSSILAPGTLWCDGKDYLMATYPDLAWYRGFLDTYAEQVLAVPNRSAYYKLNETSGTNCADSSGSGLNCTYTGSPTLGQTGAITDETGTSVLFASGKYASRASGSSPWGTTTVLSRFVGGWVYITGSMTGIFFYTNGVGLGIGNTTAENSGTHLVATYDGVRWMNTNVNMSVGWHFVGISVASGLHQIMMDGAIVYQDTGTNPTSTSTATYIGCGNTALRPFAGRVDEVVFVNRAVDEAEFKRLYFRGKHRFFVADLRGRAPVGLDNLGGTAAGRLTSSQVLDAGVGEEKHILLSAESGVAAHGHGVNDGGHEHSTPGNGYVYGSGSPTIQVQGGGTYGFKLDTLIATNYTGVTIQNAAAANAAQGHNTMQPSLLGGWAVKT